MITIDVETKSYADLPKVGAWNYSLDPSTDIICLCYCFSGPDSDPSIRTWWPGDPLPTVDLFWLIEEGLSVEAHNVAFEEALWYNVLMPKYGFPDVAPDQWRDTMATACYLALPAGLDRLSTALGGEGKDSEGTRLITKYSKLYLKTAKPEIPPEDKAKWGEYCEDDVAQEAGIGDFLGNLPLRELDIFLRSRRINRRGIYLDLEGISSASRVVDGRSKELVARFQEIVGLNPTQTEKVRGWLKDNGITLSNLQKGTIQELLQDEEVTEDVELEPGIFEPAKIATQALGFDTLSPQVREALEIKLAVSKASTRKLDAMARNAGPDGRARDQTRYHGATTGRETGMGFQPLNLVRSYEDADPMTLIRAIRQEDPELLDMMYGDAMEAVSKASRHWIMAAPGNRLLAGDFSSIEAVILSCLAGEDWKIQAFHDREPLYERMGEKIHKLPVGTVTKKTHPDERYDGKIGELAFGFQGALGAWLKFDPSGRHTEERIVEICKAWRSEHPAIVALWKGYDECMVHALMHSGSHPKYNGVKFHKQDHWLTIELLNGKKLWYFQPEFRNRMPAYHRPDDKEACRDGTCTCKPHDVVTYMSMKTGQWKRISTYGGKITENVVQATSREMLEDKKVILEEKGYDIILSVYDEIVAEMPKGKGNLDEFAEIMARREGFYENWPVFVDAWEGERYKK